MTFVVESRTYEFDGNLLVIQKIRSLEEHAERAFTNLLADPVVNPNHVGR